ncbi:MAG TPA: LEA type 2 family protein [Chitinophagales bacterium]|nr:LEA type 2 family protein [Chitinophagales bacterium]
MKSFIRLPSYIFCLTSLFMTACAPLKPLEFRSLSDFKVEKLTSTPSLSVNLNLHNPNSFGGTMKEFHLDFFLSDVPIATIQLQNIRMPSQSDFTLPLSTNPSYEQLIKLLPSGISSFTSGKQIPVKLTGSVTVKKFIFKKRLPFEFHDSINTKDIRLN